MDKHNIINTIMVVHIESTVTYLVYRTTRHFMEHLNNGSCLVPRDEAIHKYVNILLWKDITLGLGPYYCVLC